MLEDGTTANLPAALKRVLGRVWDLAREPEGCREVQLALEAAQSDQARAAIAAELEGHVWEAVRCPHANHVIQKCVVAMRPVDLQFILDELMAGSGPPSGASQAARHRYGCRVVERLMEHCPPDQVRPLMQSLIADGVALSRHPYGNYVMQHLLEHGPADQRRSLIRLLAQYPQATGSDCYARAVISKALSHGLREDQVMLTYALIREPGLLASMARTRHGHVAAKFALQRLDGRGRAEARGQLLGELTAIRASRYGRSIAAFLEQHAACSS